MAVTNKGPEKVVLNTFQTKQVTLPAADKTSGANASSAANAFEQRVSQETGTH